MTSQVFSTPELLEEILAYLSLPSLLFVQGVSKTWKNTICSSPKLQQALFLHPLPSSTQPIFNPLLRGLFPPLFASFPDIHDLPLLRDELPSLPWYRAMGGVDHRDAVLRKEASWRKMYPVQPPAVVSGIEMVSTCGCTWNFYAGTFKKEIRQETQRMGFIYDIVIHLMDFLGGRELGIRWCMFQDEEEGTEEQKVLRNEIEIVELHTTDCYVADFDWVMPSGFRSEGDVFKPWEVEWDKTPNGYARASRGQSRVKWDRLVQEMSDGEAALTDVLEGEDRYKRERGMEEEEEEIEEKEEEEETGGEEEKYFEEYYVN